MLWGLWALRKNRKARPILWLATLGPFAVFSLIQNKNLCGNGFWGGQRLSLADDVMGTGPRGGQPLPEVLTILLIQGGPLVVYSSHAFTDQVTGFRGPMKRSIGRRVMADQLKTMFEAARKKAAP